jgi:hypothetical protein
MIRGEIRGRPPRVGVVARRWFVIGWVRGWVYVNGRPREAPGTRASEGSVAVLARVQRPALATEGTGFVKFSPQEDAVQTPAGNGARW